MEYIQEQIKPLLDDSQEYGIRIKIKTDNKETKWFNIPKESLIELYNSLN